MTPLDILVSQGIESQPGPLTTTISNGESELETESPCDFPPTAPPSIENCDLEEPDLNYVAILEVLNVSNMRKYLLDLLKRSCQALFLQEHSCTRQNQPA